MTETATIRPPVRRNEPKLNRNPPLAQLKEAAIWQPMPGGWRRLYGGIYELGVSIEWHDFELPQAFEWSRSFHPESLELCLNVSGRGCLRSDSGALDFGPLTAGFYLPGNTKLRAWRKPGDRHRFLTVEFSRGFLRAQLAGCDGALHPLVGSFVRDDAPRAGFGEIHRLAAAQEQRIAQVLHPSVVQGARPLWYQGKVLQIMSEFFFERRGGDELFCDRHKRLARERVDRVVALLRKHLVEPLSLEAIGRETGCSPFHLSRTFSAETGTTIPQYLRKLRMERAAELLQSGKCNVTEAALEVGYSSLSHFSQSFCQVMGRCPGLYPLKISHPAAASRGNAGRARAKGDDQEQSAAKK